MFTFCVETDMPAELTVIIPCYNEASRLQGLIELVRAEQARPWEWLFVDDGSTDETAARLAELAKELPERVRVLSYTPNRGKGYAVRQGVEAAQGELCGYVDADLAASPLTFLDYLGDEAIRRGETLLVGIRLKTQAGQVQRYLYRHLMGRVFQTFTNVLLGLSVYDTQCGFKLLQTARARELSGEMSIEGFAFDVELLALALRHGMKIREELIPWQEQGNSSIRPRHILQMMRDILRIRNRLKRLTTDAS